MFDNPIKLEADSFYFHLDEVVHLLEKLSYHEFGEDYVGMYSNKFDNLYFTLDDGKINLEYEIIWQEQAEYGMKITALMKALGYEVVEKTYGNSPEYDGLDEAPVLRFESKATYQEMAKIATDIMIEVFGHTLDSQFEVIEL